MLKGQPPLHTIGAAFFSCNMHHHAATYCRHNQTTNGRRMSAQRIKHQQISRFYREFLIIARAIMGNRSSVLRIFACMNRKNSCIFVHLTFFCFSGLPIKIHFLTATWNGSCNAENIFPSVLCRNVNIFLHSTLVPVETSERTRIELKAGKHIYTHQLPSEWVRRLASVLINHNNTKWNYYYIAFVGLHLQYFFIFLLFLIFALQFIYIRYICIYFCFHFTWSSLIFLIFFFAPKDL